MYDQSAERSRGGRIKIKYNFLMGSGAESFTARPFREFAFHFLVSGLIAPEHDLEAHWAQSSSDAGTHCEKI